MKIAIISGKGGSGKSSVTAAFVALSENVVAVDCDVDASNLPLVFQHNTLDEEKFVSGYQLNVNNELCIGCGICEDNCAFHAIHVRNGLAEQNPFLCEDCRLCERLCPTHSISLTPEKRSVIYKSKFSHGFMIHGHLYPGDDNSGKMIARIREIADETMKNSMTDLQLLDGPPGIGCPVISTITGMDRIVIIAEPTHSGLADLKRALQVSSSFCRNISVIINKYNINDEYRQYILSLCKATNIPVIAEIPFNKNVVNAQVQGKSIIEYAPHSTVSMILKEAYLHLLA